MNSKQRSEKRQARPPSGASAFWLNLKFIFRGFFSARSKRGGPISPEVDSMQESVVEERLVAVKGPTVSKKTDKRTRTLS